MFFQKVRRLCLADVVRVCEHDVDVLSSDAELLLFCMYLFIGKPQLVSNTNVYLAVGLWNVSENLRN